MTNKEAAKRAAELCPTYSEVNFTSCPAYVHSHTVQLGMASDCIYGRGDSYEAAFADAASKSKKE